MSTLTLGWHIRPKMLPTVIGQDNDLAKLVTIVTVNTTTTGGQQLLHTQNSAQSTWLIVHNFNKKPVVTLMDFSGNIVESNITHLDDNVVQIDFTNPTAGVAQLYA